MAVTFDAAGSVAFGSSASAATITYTWSHTAAVGSLVLIYPAVMFSAALPAGLSGTITYGGVTVPLLRPVMSLSGTSSGALFVFAIANPLTGAQTISCTISWTGAVNYYKGGVSVSYKGVGAIGQIVTNSANSTAATVTGQSQLGRLTHGQIAMYATQSGFNQTSRVVTSPSALIGSQNAGDASAAKSVFSATGSSAQPWFATAIDLIPGRNFGMPLKQAVQRAALV